MHSEIKSKQLYAIIIYRLPSEEIAKLSQHVIEKHIFHMSCHRNDRLRIQPYV